MTLDILFNAIGIAGMLCFLVAYFQLQKGDWGATGFAYLFANLLGAICLMISLLWSFNLASFLLECAWLVITMYGLVKWYRQKNRKTSS